MFSLKSLRLRDQTYRTLWIIGGLFALALSVRVLALVLFPFDGLYGQDAFAYYDYSIALRSSLINGQPLPAFFWPIGFPLHLVLSFSLLGVQPISAQMISLIAGASIAPLTYLVARESLIDLDRARAQRAGLVAGSIMIVAGQLMISSLSIMSDAVALAWATASAWLLLRYTRNFKSSDLILSVLALSIAIMSRWAYALLALPWTLSVLSLWRSQWPLFKLRRAIGLTLLALVMVASVLIAPQFLGMTQLGTFQVHGWNPINALRSEVTNLDGTFQFALPMGLYYLRPLIDPSFLFPVWLPLWLIGVWSLRQYPAAKGWVLAGWPLAQYLYLIGDTYQNPRFSLAFLPALAIWVGLGFDRRAAWQAARRSNWRRGLIGLIAIGLIGSLIWSVRVTGNFIEQKNDDLRVVRRVQAEVPAGSTLLAFGLTATLQHYTDLRVIELYNLDEAALGSEMKEGGSHYLLIDPDNVESQWPGKAPALNYQWLQTHRILTSIASFPPYELFRVD
jgi:4-amino-4-deoxy-L-arabinose transferase-like glycosyltransferase